MLTLYKIYLTQDCGEGWRAKQPIVVSAECEAQAVLRAMTFLYSQYKGVIDAEYECYEVCSTPDVVLDWN